ncbi:MAG: hypothetical protein JW993_17455 [Sedimentisphaerales bacterium]|nr:hypothetical protein [Sedimentisphaerales bacterium]
MKSVACSMIVFATFLVPEGSAARAGQDVLNIEEVAKVRIALTKFDVTDTSLELSWRIRNDTDHDVWICDRLVAGLPSEVESIAGEDGKTLLLRRRFDLPQQEITWEHARQAYYVRLRPDREKVESCSLPVPVPQYPVFGPLYAHGAYADRLTLEIGYYDEDLPGLILKMVDLAEQLGCDTSLQSPLYGSADPTGFLQRFFAGLMIARGFHLDSWAYFRNSVMSGGDEVILPYMWQALNGERVLRVTIDPVTIPYKGGAWPVSTEGK